MTSASEQVFKKYLSKVPWSRGNMLVNSFIQYPMFIENILFSMGLIVHKYRVIWKRGRAVSQYVNTYFLSTSVSSASLDPSFFSQLFLIYTLKHGGWFFKPSQMIHFYLQLDISKSLPAAAHLNYRPCNLPSHWDVLGVKHCALRVGYLILIKSKAQTVWIFAM